MTAMYVNVTMRLHRGVLHAEAAYRKGRMKRQVLFRIDLYVRNTERTSTSPDNETTAGCLSWVD